MTTDDQPCRLADHIESEEVDLFAPETDKQFETKRVSPWLIYSAPINNQIYKPVSPDDPDILALADDIREKGLLEPLVITEDFVIVSGHRRHAACKLALLKDVPCRILPLRSTSERFPALLVAYNKQRVKGTDEILREEIAQVNPEEAHRALVESRARKSELTANVTPIPQRKGRSRISAAKEPMLRAVRKVIEDLRPYWPLTDRFVHYQLLNDPPLRHRAKPKSTYRNNEDFYNDLTDLLTRARVFGRIPWEALHDPTRPQNNWNVHPSAQPFIREQVDGFLKGYYRDYMRTQPHHIEIICEKATLKSILSPVAMEYCIPMLIGKGYCSIDPRYQMAQRFRRSGKHKLVLLYLSDFDPEGEDIPKSFGASMRDDFNLANINLIRVALTADQVRSMRLPPILTAKETSSRASKFIAEHGDTVHELEAVHPRDLQRILRDHIESVIDREAFEKEVEAEKQEAAKLEACRRRVAAVLGEMDPHEEQ